MVFIQDFLILLAEIAWVVFVLAWATDRALGGSPIPKFKERQHIIEDVIMTSFILAIMSTIFYYIFEYIVPQL